MSSKPSTTTTTSQQKTKEESTRSPWAPAAGYLTDLYQTGSNALEAVNNKLFGGDFVTPANATQRSVPGMLTAVAPTLSEGAIPLREIASRIASGEFLDPNNQILQNAIAAVRDPAKLSLMNDILPQISDAAVKGGAYGGTAPALLESEAISRFNRDSLNAGNTMTLDWFNQRFGDVFRSPELFKTANMLDLAPATVTGQAGDYERSLDDYKTQDELLRYQNELAAPWYGINDFTNLLTAGGYGEQKGSGSSSGTQVSTQPAPSMATQLLQGGLGGLSTLASLGQAFPATMGSLGSIFSGLGGATAAGSAAGGISAMLPMLAALSDRRMKQDIVQIGRADNGLPIYRFKYLGESSYHIGFMADEVEEKFPDAVFRNPLGIKYVDYKRATEIN